MFAKAVILTDGKAGHENQSKALARALGFDFTLVPVKFKSPAHKALSYVFDALGIHSRALFEFPSGETAQVKGAPAITPADLVIGTGSGTFYPAKTLARGAHGAKCAVVLYPRGYDLSTFDCIFAPSFDKPARKSNVVEISANFVSQDMSFYEKGVRDFRERYSGDVSNIHAVIVGGPNKCSTMEEGWMKSELDRIFAQKGGAAMCVTTSRRTPPAIERLVDSYPWDYKLIYSRDHFNPIPAFVSLAKKLYVTAESTGMLSEACTCGNAEVVALDNLKPGRHKFRRFLESLAAEGYVGGARKIDLSHALEKAKALLGISRCVTST